MADYRSLAGAKFAQPIIQCGQFPALARTHREKCSDRRRWDVAPQYFFDHIFLDRCGQSLPHEFSDAQISQHCNKRKLADSTRRQWEISRYLFASLRSLSEIFAEPAVLTIF